MRKSIVRKIIIKKIIVFCLVPLALVEITSIKAAEEKGDFYGPSRSECEQDPAMGAQQALGGTERALAALLAEHTGVPISELEPQLIYADTDHDIARAVERVLKTWHDGEKKRNEDAIYRPYMEYRRAYEKRRTALVLQAKEFSQAIKKEDEEYQAIRRLKIRQKGWNVVGAQELDAQLEADHAAHMQARALLVAKRNEAKGAAKAAYEQYEAIRISRHREYTSGREQIAERTAAAKGHLNQFFAQYMPSLIIG